MNKTYQELCDELQLLREQLVAAQQIATAATERANELAFQLDEAHSVVLQLTANALNFHNRCKQLEKQLRELPRPMAVRRISDQSLELSFHSCRLASEFEGKITNQGEGESS